MFPSKQKLRTLLRKKWETFCHETSVHGFRELFYSKTMLWAFIWSTTMAFVVGLAISQVYKAILQVVKQPTATLISPLYTEADIDYPPIKICYLHWMLWVNFSMAQRLGFDREGTNYGLSYLDDIITSLPLNATRARENFELTMKKNNMSRVTQFLSAISNPSPPGFRTNLWNMWEKSFDPTYTRFCYVATPSMIRQGLAQNGKTQDLPKNVLLLMFDNNYFVLDPRIVNIFDYNIYSRYFVEAQIHHPLPQNISDLSNLKVAPVINVDGVRINFILPTREIYRTQVQITGTFTSWMSSDKRPCSSAKVTDSYYFCDKLCHSLEMRRKYNGTCLNIEGAWITNRDEVNNVCRHFIIQQFLTNPQMFPGDAVREPLEEPYARSFSECIARYCATPCQERKFAGTASVSVRTPNALLQYNMPSLIYIEYPEAKSILVTTEIVSQTWESVVATVGGILGLWIGTSLLSIVQLVYLICFNFTDRLGSSVGLRNKKEINNKKEIILRRINKNLTVKS